MAVRAPGPVGLAACHSSESEYGRAECRRRVGLHAGGLVAALLLVYGVVFLEFFTIFSTRVLRLPALQHLCV